MVISEEQFKIGKEYLRLAEIDLDVARTLYNNQIYNLAIFHLQQAIEKITKCVCLVITIDEKENSMLTLEEIKKEHNAAKLMLNAAEKIFDILEKQAKKLNLLKEYLVKPYQDLINNLKKELKQLKGRDSKEEIAKTINTTKSLNITQFFNIKKMPKSSQFLNEYFLHLATLGAIVFPHYESSRYPFNDKNDIHPQEYKPTELGVVDAFDELYNYVRSMLIKIKEKLDKNAL